MKNLYIGLMLFCSLSSMGQKIYISQVFYDSPLEEDKNAAVISNKAHHNGEFIELYNPSKTPVDISDWGLTGDGATEKFYFPAGTIFPAGSYLIVAYRHFLSQFCLSDLFPDIKNQETAGLIIYQNKIILNNRGEGIILADNNNDIVDRMYYNGTNKGPLFARNGVGRVNTHCFALHRHRISTDQNGNRTFDVSDWGGGLVRPFGRQVTTAVNPADIEMPQAFGQLSPSQDQNYIITIVPFTEVSDLNTLSDANSNATIQYFDGLGRLSQTVQKAITPNGSDLVSGVTYDAFGRESQQWLPVVAQGNNGAYVSNYQTLAVGQSAYSEGNPYNLTEYEPSPLNRVTKQYGPGTAWQSNGKSQKTDYIANGTDVKYFYVEGDVLKCNGNYPAASLYGVGSIDEDNKHVVEYTDKLGRKILTRADNDKDAYYVYDDFGNLRYVLPPLAADSLSGVNNSISEAKGSPVDLYGYVYKYDERNRNIMKKLPGCDSICMVYDRADRLLASQDGNQRTKGEWTVNKYDVFGRLLYSGIYAGSETRTQLAAAYSGSVTNETYTGSGDTGGYSCANLIPATLLTVNYYDSYDFLNQSAYASVKGTLTDFAMTGYTSVDKNYTKTLLTGTRVYHLDDAAKYETTVMYYDKYGHVVQTRATNHLGGYDMVYNKVDFLGKPLQTFKTHGVNGASTTTTELYAYTYDKAQRQLVATLSLNGGASVTLSENTYDDLGRLKTKKTGDAIETVNYSYNIRSWVTGITGTRFTENLSYNTNPANIPNFTACYNGNIAAMQWSITSENLGYNRAYSFLYDNLNRLTICNYSGVNNGIVITGTSSLYVEVMNYDKMGNITTLTRLSGGPVLNNLTFSYTGNQLKTVNDAVSATPGYGSEAFADRAKLALEYLYDKNGNMTWDANSGISTIEYNSLNLPDIIQFTEGHKNYYTYDAAGQKLNLTNYTLHNTVTVPQGTISALPANANDYTKISTDYVGNMIYENGSLKEILLPEGYWQDGVYYYYLKDHLGNNRLVINSSGEIIEKSHYYPSGMRFQSSTSNNAALPYRYGGKELEAMNGLNQYDSDARRRFASIPVTTTMDPLCEKYYPVSPYAWCGNNPMKYVDSNGKDIRIFYVTGYDRWGEPIYGGSWVFNGTNQSQAPSNSFVQDFITAYNYNVGNGGGESMYQLANSREMITNLRDAIGTVTKYAPNDNFIYWDSRLANRTKDGIVRSPATHLEHEMDHALDYLTDPVGHNKRVNTPDKQYENAEERRVITGSEVKTAHANHEFHEGYVRPDHDEHGGGIRVSDPTKTTPMPNSPQQQKQADPSWLDRLLQWLIN